MNDQLKSLNIKIGEAEKAKDKDFFEKNLSESLIFRRASGKIHTKKEFLKGLDNTNLHYHYIKTDIKNILISEDGLKAVVKAIVFVKMTNEGKEIEGHYTNLRFFQKQNDAWILTSWYNERVDENKRQYKTTDLQTLLEDFPKLDEDKRTSLWTLYGHVCSSWEKLVDIRFKLLGLVPGVTILLLIELSKQTQQAFKIFGGILGLIFTLAIFIYEIRNTQLHDDLISRAKKIESELGIETGQFLGRKKNSPYFVKHDVALCIIYIVSIVSWLVFILIQ